MKDNNDQPARENIEILQSMALC